jgi:hypothetical protein
MVLLAVVPSKYVKLVLKQSRCVIFNLRCLYYRPIIVLLVSLNAMLMWPESVDEASKTRLARLLVALAFAHQDPLELLGQLLASDREVIWRVVGVCFVRHAHILDTNLLLVII